MDYRALQIMLNYIRKQVSGEFEIFTVWKAKILNNCKYIFKVDRIDGRIYELTYNGQKNEWYLDAYKKLENIVIEEEENE